MKSDRGNHEIGSPTKLKLSYAENFEEPLYKGTSIILFFSLQNCIDVLKYTAPKLFLSTCKNLCLGITKPFNNYLKSKLLLCFWFLASFLL